MTHPVIATLIGLAMLAYIVWYPLRRIEDKEEKAQ